MDGSERNQMRRGRQEMVLAKSSIERVQERSRVQEGGRGTWRVQEGEREARRDARDQYAHQHLPEEEGRRVNEACGRGVAECSPI
jgi:hypothetical protein